MIEINVGKQSSEDPSGRYYTDGKGSGEEFREEVLIPALNNAKTTSKKILIILDDEVEGYGSSFLVEAFAGVVKYGHMTADELIKLLEFRYDDPDFEFYKNRTLQYINEASFNSEIYNSTKKE